MATISASLRTLPGRWVRRLLAIVLSATVLGGVHLGYCWGWWLRNNLLAQALFQCNCPAASEAVRYAPFRLVAAACSDPWVRVSPSGSSLLITEFAARPPVTVLIDVTTGARSVLRDANHTTTFVTHTYLPLRVHRTIATTSLAGLLVEVRGADVLLHTRFTGTKRGIVLACLCQAERAIWATAYRISIVIVLAVVFPETHRANGEPAAFVVRQAAAARAGVTHARLRWLQHGICLELLHVGVEPAPPLVKLFGRWVITIAHDCLIMPCAERHSARAG